MKTTCLLAGLLLALTACGSGDEPKPAEKVQLLQDGRLDPGRYSFAMHDNCDPLLGCPRKPDSSRLPAVELTTPLGWVADTEFSLVHPAIPAEMGGPDGAALVMGWTTDWAGLNSEPCAPLGTPGGHQVPDIEVGPTVDDFVEAVQAHPKLHVTSPEDTTLGGYRARFFSLRAPSDVSRCDGWRPWDPGFYAQGPDNIWDVWVVDVKGTRVLIVTDYFPATSSAVKKELRDMVRSVRFVT